MQRYLAYVDARARHSVIATIAAPYGGGALGFLLGWCTGTSQLTATLAGVAAALYVMQGKQTGEAMKLRIKTRKLLIKQSEDEQIAELAAVIPLRRRHQL
ncbi:hypothetical protein [Actinomadura violacea]|uniref:Uncharacterized protein n=1 Tax=Actinomadura violacea TaxID=2819934 RepID=A0ABS3RZM3_9ACTN|nr:hypothetical protein [Actinomadura violacea]MBO2461499.1 hypothetical protein [Actinomadura violacea]